MCYVPATCSRGAYPFRSDAPQTFYSLLLRSPSAARHGLKSKQYTEQLAVASGESAELAALLHRDQAIPRPMAAPIADDGGGIAGDDGNASDDAPAIADGGAIVGGEGLGDDAVVAEPETLEPVPLPEPVVDQAALVEQAIAGDEEAVAADGIPLAIMGIRVKVERHFDNERRVTAEGIRVQCPNLEHRGHMKYRSLWQDRAVFGPRAAEFFLGAWLCKAHSCTLQEHAKPPSRAEVQRYADTHGGH